MMHWHSIKSSFVHAWQGLLLAFKHEQSFRIQIVGALVVFILILLLPLERWERSLLILAAGAVLVLELLNSVVERFVDMVKPRIHEYAKEIKDLAAAAVFVMACTAAILALIIFWPYIPLLSRV
ncbi:MAG: diacylglycerol kinase family protein [Patescibacteria group bacterium]|jgi:diacylglycerol kinase|nr:diacylglycerol kinase family protein [Patescibacteria group bacterium]